MIEIFKFLAFLSNLPLFLEGKREKLSALPSSLISYPKWGLLTAKIALLLLVPLAATSQQGWEKFSGYREHRKATQLFLKKLSADPKKEILYIGLGVLLIPIHGLEMFRVKD